MPTLGDALSLFGVPGPLATSIDSQSPAVAWALTALAVAGVVFHQVWKQRKKAWIEQRRDHKRQQCRDSIQDLAEERSTSTVSVEKQKEILTLPLLELRDCLHSGKLKALDVLHAYQIKALAENEKVNAIIEPIKEAEVLAQACDSRAPPDEELLHGVPISIKDSVCMAGYDSTIGIAQWIDQPMPEDAVIVQVLKQHGAVPFVRTNVPQGLYSWDTCNPIFGQTLNPYGKNRSPGGSSGGEGALIASGGSCLGIGGDIGGSIRIPCNMCGVYGLKPTNGRVSLKGIHPAGKGQILIPPSFGPMARDVDSLALCLRVLVSPIQHTLDKTIPPLPFRNELYLRKGKLRIGYYLHDDYIHAVPAMQRAVTVATKALERLGHEIVEWNFPGLGNRGCVLWGKTTFADGGEEMLADMKYDKTDHSVGVLVNILKINNRLKALIAFLLKLWYPRLGNNIASTSGLRSVYKWTSHVKDVLAFRKEVEEDWKEKRLDAVICPGMAVPAPPVGMHRFATGAVSYACTYNTLNFPAGSMPVTKVTKEDLEEMEYYPTPDPWHKTMKKMLDGGAEGLPCNVQVVTLPWEEEKCLSVMKELEGALGSKLDFGL